jgi:hypothetical protein
MQPPLGDQEVDHPAHPAGESNGLVERRRIDLSTSESLGDDDSEDNEHPEPECHDGKGQRGAAQHPLPVIGEPALANRSKTGQRCPKPQQRKHGICHPLIGAMQAHRGDDHDADGSSQRSRDIDTPTQAMNRGPRPTKPRPDLEAGGKQRYRTEEDVRDEQR